ncbi:MAG: GNAT family N-acetyltransferase [Mycobacterium sp.]
MGVEILVATPADATGLADVAAATFPLACPSSVAAEDVAAFIGAELCASRFAEYLADPDKRVLAIRDGSRIVGYAMLIHPAGEPAAELSKFYLLPGHHGTGTAAQLMRAALDWACGTGAQTMWLGVNRGNGRAQAFYRKLGFEVTGTRTFDVGGATEHDLLMSRPL